MAHDENAWEWQTISIMKRRLCSLILSLTAALMAASALASAGPMGATPEGGGLRPWSVPSHDVSAGMLAGLQGFLATGSGKLLLAQVPSLGFIERLSPDSEAHRRIVGAIGLPSDFEPRLRDAVRASDNKALDGALAALLDAYRRQNAEERIREAVSSRTEEIAAAFREGRTSGTELSAATAELAPFAPLSEQARSDPWRMRRVQQDAMAAARHMAAALPGSANVGEQEADGEATRGPVTIWSRWVREEEGEDHRAAFAAELLEKLDRAQPGEGSEEIVDRLRELAEDAGDEGLQRTIAHGLIFEFLTVDRDGYHLRVLDALESIALASPFEVVRKIVADGLRAHIPTGGDLSDRARDAVGTIVAASFRDKRPLKIHNDSMGIGVRTEGNPALAWAYLGLMMSTLAGAVPESLLTAAVIFLLFGYFALWK